ncbi:MAG: hypothetical protein HY207_02650 [Nitrospirae bacterium]|nr:hypothetical protein [Nitrospirota bacterium]
MAWLAVLGTAGLVAGLIVTDLVRKASNAPLRHALADESTLWLFLLAAGGAGLFLYGFKVRAMQRSRLLKKSICGVASRSCVLTYDT